MRKGSEGVLGTAEVKVMAYEKENGVVRAKHRGD